MRKVTAIILAAAMMLLIMPAAMAGSGFSLVSKSNWINIPSKADISYDIDSDGNYTIDIAVPYSSISSVQYSKQPKLSGKVFIFPISVPNDNPVYVDGGNARIYNNGPSVIFTPQSGGNSETFSVSYSNNGYEYFSVTINYYDSSKASYNSYYPYSSYYPYNSYNYNKKSSSDYCDYCNGYIGHDYSDYCYYYNNSYYYYCSNSCYANGYYQHLDNEVYPASYLKVVGIEAAGDQSGNAAVVNSGTNISVNIFGLTASDRQYITGAKSDYIRVRVQPVTVYGGTYPAGTVISATSVTNKATLEGSDIALNDKGTYSYILDKNGTFCITLPSIKSLAGAGNGKWSAITVKLGSSQTISTTVYYDNTTRSAGSSSGTGTIEPAYSSTVTVSAGGSLPLSYVIDGVVIPSDYVTWTVYNAGTGKVSLNGNVVTGITSGSAYVMAQYGNSTSIVKVNVTGTTNTGTIIAGDSLYSVTAAALNVRTGPGTSYGVVGVLGQGSVVTGYGYSNGWLKISYNGTTAYVSGNMVKKLN